MKNLKLPAHKDPVASIILDTKRQDRQTLVFCSSKRAAESQAEKLSKVEGRKTQTYHQLSQQVLSVLAHPTKQCKRLALCLETGVAFHHSGLTSKQRGLIEEAFRQGVIHTICSTPTLAAGLDLPAYRVIIRDLKRFGQRGMSPIAVLEYEQMAGRAGRPGQETHGQAIVLAKEQGEADRLEEQYLRGDVEEIYSKLAVEPVLRTYVLSLIASELIKGKQKLFDFFDSTFYAHQFGDTTKLHFILEKMIALLQEWEMLESTEEQKETGGFFSASSLLSKALDTPLKATALGKRVSELYLDPQTAHQLLEGIDQAETTPQFLHLLCCTLEMRPLTRTPMQAQEEVHAFLEEQELVIDEHQFYQVSQDDYFDTVRTTQLFLAWVNEVDEETILERFNVRPGELHAKTQRAVWLLHGASELARLTKRHGLRTPLSKLQTRVKQGVKEELLPLLQFKQVGRARARTLFKNNLRTVQDIVQVPSQTLTDLVGVALAKKLKEQVDAPYEEGVEQGQQTLDSFGKI